MFRKLDSWTPRRRNELHSRFKAVVEDLWEEMVVVRLQGPFALPASRQSAGKVYSFFARFANTSSNFKASRTACKVLERVKEDTNGCSTALTKVVVAGRPSRCMPNRTGLSRHPRCYCKYDPINEAPLMASYLK